MLDGIGYRAAQRLTDAVNQLRLGEGLDLRQEQIVLLVPPRPGPADLTPQRLRLQFQHVDDARALLVEGGQRRPVDKPDARLVAGAINPRPGQLSC